jgi:hypothetical protein
MKKTIGCEKSDISVVQRSMRPITRKRNFHICTGGAISVTAHVAIDRQFCNGSFFVP